MSKKKTYKVVDLFAGAGGMTVGFHMAGFKSALALDFDKDSCSTYQKNYPETKVVCDDIKNVTNEKIKELLGNEKVDVIIGGPPCQGFSALGKQRKDDPRNQLWQQYLRVVRLLAPKVWVMENVPELLKSQEFEEVKKLAQELGYELQAKVLNAADYGAPQRRRRAVVLAAKKGVLKHPDPTHADKEGRDLFNKNKKNWVTVKEAFAGLSKEPSGKDLHVGRKPTELSLKRYKAVPEGGNRFDLPLELKPQCWINKPTGSTDVFGRLWWDKPSLTIRTEFYKPEKGRYLHPSENRPITLREGARLQTFPDDFEFVGSYSSIGKQIGNAVPCLLAKAIAEAVKRHLEENDQDAS